MSEPEEPPLPEAESLPRAVPPPAELEERVVAALRDRRLVGPRRRRGPSWPLFAAASLVALLGGFLARGLLSRPLPGRAAGEEFVLLLSEPRPLRTDKLDADLVADYRAWAGELAARGRLESGAKLAREGRRLTSPAPGDMLEADEPPPALAAATGLFVLRARDLDEALAIARTCPHLAYGGEISVRPVERTGAAP